ncbi:MAG: hypothetical protein QOH51_3519 [Acidobacteriota bacterium]|nr:hypothetical protein [Acidobacteriota bacterium]
MLIQTEHLQLTSHQPLLVSLLLSPLVGRWVMQGVRRRENRMTTLQMLLMIGLYAVALVVVVYFTRATARRIAGALVGGAAVGLMALGAITLCEALGWWKIPFASTPYFAFIFYAGVAITCSPIYLVTWRVARRFGWRGLAMCVAIVAVIGPPRDYLYAATFPQWMVFSPGVMPVLADSATYIGIVVVGHAVMRLVAGPARNDRLARGTA